MVEIHRFPSNVAHRLAVAAILLLPYLVIPTGSTAYSHSPPPLEIRFGDGLDVTAQSVMALRRAADGPPVTAAVRLTNAASVSTKLELDETIPWLVIEPRIMGLEPGRSTVARIIATAAGLAPGDYSGTIGIRTTDPNRGTSHLEVILTVGPPIPDIVGNRAAVTEMSTACNNGNIFVQFIELSAAPGDPLPGNLQLTVEDRAGYVTFDESPFGDAAPTPAARTWLLATPEFEELTGAAPDRVMSALLDVAGGTITLRRGEEILQRFSYGSTGGVNAPRPGSSLARSASGTMVEQTPPAPETSHGVTPARLNCVCPLSELVLKGVRQISDLSEGGASQEVPGLFYGRIGYSMQKGSFYAEVGSLSAGVEAADRYTILGVRAGTLLNVTAVLEMSGRLGGGGAMVGELTAEGFPAVIRVQEGNPNAPDVTSEVRLPLQLAAFRSYALTSVLGVQSNATIQARLVFEGLPPGARVESCRGYVFQEPPLDLRVQSRFSRGVARIVWKMPGVQSLVNVERRRGSEPWTPVTAAEPDEFGTIIHDDPSVETGVPYSYRLNLWSGPAGETSLDWSVPPFRIGEAFPNPTRGPISVTVDVPDDAPVRIALYDVAGRRVDEQRLSYPEPGRYVVELGDRKRAAGLYLMTVEHGTERRATKVIVFR